MLSIRHMCFSALICLEHLSSGTYSQNACTARPARSERSSTTQAARRNQLGPAAWTQRLGTNGSNKRLEPAARTSSAHQRLESAARTSGSNQRLESAARTSGSHQRLAPAARTSSSHQQLAPAARPERAMCLSGPTHAARHNQSDLAAWNKRLTYAP